MITLPKLSYALGDLEPHISKEAMEFHRNKHHKGYVTNLNKLIEGTEYEGLELEEIIKKAKGPIFNNAAQIWNHTFYFEGIAPQPVFEKAEGGESSVTHEMVEYLSAQFGSYNDFVEEFSDAAKKLFGSGWVWLIHEEGKGKILAYKDAETPLLTGDAVPLLTWDCWEHNYYIDHRNDRAAALEAFWKVVNWGKMTEHLGENWK